MLVRRRTRSCRTSSAASTSADRDCVQLWALLRVRAASGNADGGGVDAALVTARSGLVVKARHVHGCTCTPAQFGTDAGCYGCQQKRLQRGSPPSRHPQPAQAPTQLSRGGWAQLCRTLLLCVRPWWFSGDATGGEAASPQLGDVVRGQRNAGASSPL
jgi:hypothetical protein